MKQLLLMCFVMVSEFSISQLPMVGMRLKIPIYIIGMPFFKKQGVEMPGKGRSPNFLNVREQLKLTEEIIDIFKKYGDCPLVRQGFARVSLLNRAILRKHELSRAKGNRKDIPIQEFK